MKNIKKGVLPRATSQIAYDEYFHKAILELIYSKRNTAEEIIGFFEFSLFNFQATRQKVGLVSYDLRKLLKSRIKYRNDAGFLEPLGITY